MPVRGDPSRGMGHVNAIRNHLNLDGLHGADRVQAARVGLGGAVDQRRLMIQEGHPQHLIKLADELIAAAVKLINQHRR
jgi:hypothetical protein